MKYACDIRDMERVAEERGEKRGELRNSLKSAEKMLDTHELSVIANFFEIPLEYVVALNDGCSVESIIDEINWD